MKALDEKGFVFLDADNRPYLCAVWNEHPWLFYWHLNNHWVSLRQVSQQEIWSFPRNLSEEDQALYWKIHDEYNNHIHPSGTRSEYKDFAETAG